MEIKIKKLNKDTITPFYAKPGDAGMDLTATSINYNNETSCWEYGTGIAIEIPKGHVGLVFPRSSIYKHRLILSNSVGIIDSEYRGEIKVIFYNRDTTFAGFKTFFNLLFERKKALEKNIRILFSANSYKIGDRIAQLVIIPYPQIEFKEVEELSDTERGTGGYGSTGK